MSADSSATDDEARERILSAALRLVEEGGGDALEVGALLRATSVAPATFDALFGDIATVRYYLVLRTIEQVYAVRREIMRATKEPHARLGLAVRRFLDYIERQPALYDAFRRASRERGPVGDLSRRNLAALLAELGPTISGLQGRADMTDLIAEALLPQIFPVIDHWLDNRDRIERGEVERFILSSLGADAQLSA